jgi:signal transduction histidine kinase
MAMNSSFVPLDYWAHGDHFRLFLALRLVWNAAMLGLVWALQYFNPTRVMRGACLVIGFSLLSIIGAAGGATSYYWPGLMILFVGIPVFLPFSAKEAFWIVGVLAASFAGLPLATGETVTARTYLVPLFFVLATAAEAVFSSSLMDRLRFADFRQRQELEEARDHLKEMDRTKSRFTANVHHELRTPLTLTLAPLEAMLGGEFGEVTETQRSYLRSMHSNALRLLKLINNLLDLAKIEGKQLKIRRRPTQISRLIEDLVSGARPLAERKGVVLETRGVESLPIVNVDQDAIEKVIVNLVGNSLKFTERGGRIETSGTILEDGSIELAVTDTGAGLPPDQLERIFDRFAQVDSSNTRRHEGTGIGLALVKELVELHGGRVWAESEGLGRGSSFRVVLPRGEVDEEAEEEVFEETTKQSASLGNTLAAMEGEIELDPAQQDGLRLAELARTAERIEKAQLPADVGSPTPVPPARDAGEVLVVEDNADMRRLIMDLLGREFRVRAARNGREGLEAARERHPDLVLTDVMMPEMSGTELCKALKTDPATRAIPVMLVTSKAEREMKIEGLELGADDYVTKPFHPRELLARARSLVRLRRLQSELAKRNALLESTNAELEGALSDLRDAGVQLVQAERLAAVGELAAGVAHEVNNPVNFATNALKTLRTYVEDIRRVTSRFTELEWSNPSKLSAQAREIERLENEVGFDELIGSLGELVEIVTEGLERTHRLVADLRDFASPGAGKRGEVNLRRGIESTLQLMRHALRKAEVEVQVEIAEDLPVLTGDARAINQVFLNLLKNAAEALEDRGGSVVLSAAVDGAWVVVRVRDDGPGVAPELHAKLFEPFYSTKEAGRGTGLGLSISRRILNDHGGSIEVESAPGQGTTFIVRLPVGDRERDTQA